MKVKESVKKTVSILFVGVCGVLSLYYFKNYLIILLDAIDKEFPVVEFSVADFYLIGLGLICCSIAMGGFYEKILNKPISKSLNYMISSFLVVIFVLTLIIPTIARYSVAHVLSKKGYAQCLDEYPYTLGRIPVYYYSKDQSLCKSGRFKD